MASLEDRGGDVIEARSRSACLELLRRAAGRGALTVEVVPELVGVAEAAEILGWDKRRLFTYISRGSFPEPVAFLASGRVWRKRDVEAYVRARRRRT
jgi:predicted DNA-binding transcriptional regulator AlpA